MTIPSNPPIVLGIDVGTSGVRSLAATAEGEVLAEARAPLSDLPAAGSAHEQDANAWWRAVCQTIQELRGSLETDGALGWHLAGIAVTSTSGSLVLADSQGEPVRPAMLYDDGRAGAVASELNRRLPAGQAPINASFSLAKALWVRQEEPSVWERAAYILHPADWLTAKLTGQWGVCDYSNALKLGYDPEKSDWTAAVGLAEHSRLHAPPRCRSGGSGGSGFGASQRANGIDRRRAGACRRLRRPREPDRFRGERSRAMPIRPWGQPWFGKS